MINVEDVRRDQAKVIMSPRTLTSRYRKNSLRKMQDECEVMIIASIDESKNDSKAKTINVNQSTT